MKISIVLRSLALTLAVAGFSAPSFGLSSASPATLAKQAKVVAVTPYLAPVPMCSADHTSCGMIAQ
jgi:tRNA-binding EMAP/Myf-like protein